MCAVLHLMFVPHYATQPSNENLEEGFISFLELTATAQPTWCDVLRGRALCEALRKTTKQMPANGRDTV